MWSRFVFPKGTEWSCGFSLRMILFQRDDDIGSRSYLEKRLHWDRKGVFEKRFWGVLWKHLDTRRNDQIAGKGRGKIYLFLCRQNEIVLPQLVMVYEGWLEVHRVRLSTSSCLLMSYDSFFSLQLVNNNPGKREGSEGKLVWQRNKQPKKRIWREEGGTTAKRTNSQKIGRWKGRNEMDGWGQDGTFWGCRVNRCWAAFFFFMLLILILGIRL